MLLRYKLSDNVSEHINVQWRPENEIGFALLIRALRYPGRL